MRSRWSKAPGLDILSAHLVDYPSPANLGMGWAIGSSAGLWLGIQIVTGIFLAMHYTPHVDLAFSSVEHIMRDVQGGWLILIHPRQRGKHVLHYRVLAPVQELVLRNATPHHVSTYGVPG